MNYELFTYDNKKIYLVDMKHSTGYFSELVEKSIHKQLSQHKKILLLTNKSGYASGIYCTSCSFVPQCKQCSVSIAYHQAENGLMYGICPICKTLYDMPKLCEKCGSDTLQPYGLTLQKTAERVRTTFDTKPLLIESKSTSSLPKSTKILEAISQHSIIISNYVSIPTSDRDRFDLVVVLASDQLLTLPDYTTHNQTFYNLHRVLHHFLSPFIIIQSYNTQHPAIRHALKNQESQFLSQEKDFLSQHHYPDQGELAVIKYNHDNETTLHNAINKLSQELHYLQQSYEYPDIEILSASPLIYQKFGKYYYHIILKGDHVRSFLDIAFSKLHMRKRGYKVDRMAESIL